MELADYQKSNRQIKIEEQWGESIQPLVRRLIYEGGSIGCANELEVDQGTIYYWMFKWNWEIRRVAVGKGSEVIVYGRGGNIEQSLAAS